jgi:hypothetical protein
MKERSQMKQDATESAPVASVPPVLSEDVPPTALCRCGSRNSRVLVTLRTILFGQRTRWRCRDCGDVWWTLP